MLEAAPVVRTMADGRRDRTAVPWRSAAAGLVGVLALVGCGGRGVHAGELFRLRLSQEA